MRGHIYQPVIQKLGLSLMSLYTGACRMLQDTKAHFMEDTAVMIHDTAIQIGCDVCHKVVTKKEHLYLADISNPGNTKLDVRKTCQ